MKVVILVFFYNDGSIIVFSTQGQVSIQQESQQQIVVNIQCLPSISEEMKFCLNYG